MRTNVSRYIATLALCTLPLAPALLGAQSAGDVLAYYALLRTPVGGLPPVATSTIQSDVQSGVALALRYGYVGSGLDNPQLNNFGATAVMPFGLGTTVSLTGGVTAAGEDAGNALMLSVGADTRITELPLGGARDASRLAIAVNGELGYSKPQGLSLVSGAVGVPISLVPGAQQRDAMRIVPFVTPGFGFANASGNGDTESGTRLMFGGGVGIYNRTSTVAFNVGFQYISLQDANTQIGVALVLGGR